MLLKASLKLAVVGLALELQAHNYWRLFAQNYLFILLIEKSEVHRFISTRSTKLALKSVLENLIKKINNI